MDVKKLNIDTGWSVYYAKNAGKNAIYMLNYNSAAKKGNNASFDKIEFKD